MQNSDADKFRELIESLEKAFGRKPDTDRRLVYFQDLKDLSIEQVERAIAWCRRNLDAFPSIAQVRKAVGQGEDSVTANASAYSAPDHDQIMMVPLHFLADYGMCKREDCPGYKDHSRCDGTYGGRNDKGEVVRVPRGCCGWDRYKVYRSIEWLKKTGRTIPPNVVKWMAERGMLGERREGR